MVSGTEILFEISKCKLVVNRTHFLVFDIEISLLVNVFDAEAAMNGVSNFINFVLL